MKITFEVMGRKALREAIETNVKAEVAKLGLSEDEQAGVVKKRAKKVLDDCAVWFKDGSSATVAIDTDAKTCEVLSA